MLGLGIWEAAGMDADFGSWCLASMPASTCGLMSVCPCARVLVVPAGGPRQGGLLLHWRPVGADQVRLGSSTLPAVPVAVSSSCHAAAAALLAVGGSREQQGALQGPGLSLPWLLLVLAQLVFVQGSSPHPALPLPAPAIWPRPPAGSCVRRWSCL